jgi:hypothetical protein
MIELSEDVGYARNRELAHDFWRSLELAKDSRLIIFLRFNPDDYIKNNENITSCWSYNKQGICTVKKIKKNEWNERLNSLKEQIEYWINPQNKTDKIIEIIQLFYDIE